MTVFNTLGQLLFGTSSADQISGGAGPDTINGGYGDDILRGEGGNDVLDGERGSDLLFGGDGNDLLIAGSDAGEPQVGQTFDPTQGRNGEVDPVSRTVFPGHPFVADDVLVGGAGADIFLIKPQINAKPDILAKHTRADGTINWAGVAGENNNVHDHWVDAFGTDIIADFSRAEGDQIFLYGHTVEARTFAYEDLDADGDLETIIAVYSNQPIEGGAHDDDVLGHIIVYGDTVTIDDLAIKATETYGVIDTIDEILEAVDPDGVTDPDPQSSESDNPYLDMVAFGEPDEAVPFVEQRLTVAKVKGTDDVITGTQAGEILLGDPVEPTAADLAAPLSFWSFDALEDGQYKDARGLSNAAYYVAANGEAFLQTEDIATMPGPDGQPAALFGVTARNFAYVHHDDAYQVLNGTVALWFNPVNINRSQTILSKEGAGPGGGGDFHISFDADGRLFIGLAEGESRRDAGFDHQWQTADPVIQEGVWQHVAVSFTANGVTVYLDGAALPDSAFQKVGGANDQSLSAFQSAYLIGNENPLVLGANTILSDDHHTPDGLGVDESSVLFFSGAITDVGLWGGDTPADALSADQVAALYTDGPGDLSSAPQVRPNPVPVSDDTIHGAGGEDIIDGGAGNDDLNGGDDADIVLGGYGDDVVDGGAGNDIVAGGAGADIVMGGTGNDIVLSRSDGREPPIAQDFDRSDDPDFEIDFGARMVYPSQAEIPADDHLYGGTGADIFRFEFLINAKLDIINRHVNDDRTIDWMGVAGENRDVHDHWVDRIGDETIHDFSRDEGDFIDIVGHTVRVYDFEFIDTDGNNTLDTVLYLHSNQGRGGGAHHLDEVGTITVLDTILRRTDVSVDPGPAFGIVDTIDEYREAVTPLVLPGEPIPDSVDAEGVATFAGTVDADTFIFDRSGPYTGGVIEGFDAAGGDILAILGVPDGADLDTTDDGVIDDADAYAEATPEGLLLTDGKGPSLLLAGMTSLDAEDVFFF